MCGCTVPARCRSVCHRRNSSVPTAMCLLLKLFTPSYVCPCDERETLFESREPISEVLGILGLNFKVPEVALIDRGSSLLLKYA
jgi:hypothetical protein